MEPVEGGVVRVELDGLRVERGGLEVAPRLELLIPLVLERRRRRRRPSSSAVCHLRRRRRRRGVRVLRSASSPRSFSFTFFLFLFRSFFFLPVFRTQDQGKARAVYRRSSAAYGAQGPRVVWSFSCMVFKFEKSCQLERNAMV